MSANVERPAAGKYVDFQEYVDFQLGKARQQIRNTDLLTAATFTGVLVLGYLLLFLFADQWVFANGVPASLRWLGLLGWLAIVGCWVSWSFIRPLLLKVSGLFAAREVERAEPGLRSNLLNWADLRRAGRTIDPAVLRAIERQAATQLSKIDVADAIDHRPLLRSGYALLTVVVLLCLYAILSPKKIGPSLARILPVVDVTAPTRTEIVSVSPGNATVLARSVQEITVDLAGVMPQQVQLVYTTSDRKFRDEAVTLQPDGAAGTRFRTVLAGESGQGLLQNLKYHIVAGDATSATFTIQVDHPPSARVNAVRIEPPAYTRLPAEKLPGGNFTGWEGSQAAIEATVSAPIATAFLEFLNEPQGRPTGEQIVMTVRNGIELSASFSLAFREDGTFPRHYRIQCRTASGLQDPAPVVYEYAIRRDEAPSIVLLSPERDIEVPANAVVPLLVEARDPDFELGPITLEAQQQGKTILRDTLSQGQQPAVRLAHDLALKPLGLKAGDELTFWLEAQDNRQPRRNRKQTPPLKIRIVEPVTEQQVEQQLADDKARQQAQLAELDQANAEQAQGVDAERPMMDDAPRPRDAQEGPLDAVPPNGEQPPNAPEGAAPQGAGAERREAQPGDRPQPGRPGDESRGETANTTQPRDPAEQDAGRKPQFSPDGEDDQRVLERILRDATQRDAGSAAGEKPPIPPKAQNEPQHLNPMPRPEQNKPAGNDQTVGQGGGASNANPPQDPGIPAPTPSKSASSDPSQQPKTSPTAGGEASPPMKSQDDAGPQQPGTGANQPQSKNPLDQLPDGQQALQEGKNQPSNAQQPKQPAGTEDPSKSAGPSGGNMSKDGGKPGDKPENAAGGAKPSDDKPGMNPTPENPSAGSPQSPANPMPTPNAADIKNPSNPGPSQPNPSAGGAENSQPANTAGPQPTMPPQNGSKTSPEPGQKSEPGQKTEPGGQPTPNQPPATPPMPQPAPSATPPGASGDQPSQPMNAAGGQQPPPGSASNRPARNSADEKVPGSQPGESGGEENGKQPGDNGGMPMPPMPAPKGTPGPSDSQQPQTSGGEPMAGDMPSPGKGNPDGQKSERPQQGENGNSAQSSEGTPSKTQSGPGEPGQKSGESSPSKSNDSQNGSKTGKPSDQATGQTSSGKPSKDPQQQQPGSDPSGQPQPSDMPATGQKPGPMSPSDSPPGSDPAGQPGKNPGEKPGEKPAEKSSDGQPSQGNSQQPSPNSQGTPQQSQGQKPSEEMKPTQQGEAPGEKSPPSAAENPSSAQNQSQKPDQSPQNAPDSNQSGQGSKSSNSSGQAGNGPGQSGAGSSQGENGKKPGGSEGPGQSGGQQPGQGQSGTGQPSPNATGTPQPGGEHQGGNLPTDDPSSQGAKGNRSSQDRKPDGKNDGPFANPDPSQEPGAGPNVGDPQDFASDKGIPNGGPSGEAANLDYKKQAAELVLQRLKDGLERGDVDPGLLKELGWTEDQLQRFVDRMGQAFAESSKAPETPVDQARRIQFEEMLKNLDLNRQTATRRGTDQPSREVDQIDSRRAPVPLEYRRAWEKYTRTLSKSPAGQPNAPKP